MKRLELDRRAFLLGAGASIGAGLLSQKAHGSALDDDVLFAAGFRDTNGEFGLALLSEAGEIIHQHKLPARGHGVTANVHSERAVIFARRPGNFALAFDPNMRTIPTLFKTPIDRHFYGHGAFSSDGKLLFASENDFETGDGKIGIYDVGNGFSRIGEFASGGIGPHEIIMLPDQKTLCVANGGIKTHPQFPRTKLNLDSMRSNIAFIDVASGLIRAIHPLPETWSQLSMRHMAADHKGTVWIGGQYEGNALDQAPLLAKISDDETLEFINLPTKHLFGLKNYVGSVTINENDGTIAFSSPKGGRVLLVDRNTGQVIKSHNAKGTCGLAPNRNGIITSSENGRFGEKNHIVNWDNHIGLLR